MERYHHGGRGLEVLIPGLIRDLEQRSDNSWDFLWGSVGPPVQMMSPDDVLQWMSDISIPSDVRDVQRKDMNHGKDIHGYITQSVTDSEAIGKMMTLFRTARKPALRMLMNILQNLFPRSPAARDTCWCLALWFPGSLGCA